LGDYDLLVENARLLATGKIKPAQLLEETQA